MKNHIVLDIETKNLFSDVGGKENLTKLAETVLADEIGSGKELGYKVQCGCCGGAGYDYRGQSSGLL